MRRIEKKFNDLKEKKEKALIAFISAGDPDINTTKSLVLEMERRGADIIELGVPFSDPLADNPVLRYGEDRFVNDAVLSGIDGVIIPDLPPEESDNLCNLSIQKGLDTIF